MQMKNRVAEMYNMLNPSSVKTPKDAMNDVKSYTKNPIGALLSGTMKPLSPQPEVISAKNLTQDNKWESPQVKEERRWRKDAVPTEVAGNAADLEKQALEAFVPALLKAGAKSPEAIANVLANIKAESSFDYSRKENLKYTSPDRLKEKIGGKLSDTMINSLLGKPFEIGMATYGQRGLPKPNGKPSDQTEWIDDDPYKGVSKRGRGYIMTTSPGNYRKVNNYLNQLGYNVDLMKNPELINSDPKIAAEAAMYYLTEGGAINPEKYKDMDSIFKQVKFSGYNNEKGVEERETRKQFAQDLLPKVQDYMNKLNPPSKSKPKMKRKA